MNSQVREQLVGYARQIAHIKGYPSEELQEGSGLQLHTTLFLKFMHEMEEFKAAKDYAQRLHEAADVLYYAACLEEGNLNGDDAYMRSARNVLCTGHNMDWHQCEIAALTKYAYRAEGNPKDEGREITLILQALKGEISLQRREIPYPLDEEGFWKWLSLCDKTFCLGYTNNPFHNPIAKYLLARYSTGWMTEPPYGEAYGTPFMHHGTYRPEIRYALPPWAIEVLNCFNAIGEEDEERYEFEDVSVMEFLSKWEERKEKEEDHEF